MGSVTDLTNTSQFAAGLVAGLVAAAIVAGIALALDARARRFPLAGLAHASAALVALGVAGTAHQQIRPDAWGLVAVALAAVAGLVAQRFADPALVAMLLVPAGAAVLYDLRNLPDAWMAPVVAAAVVVGGALAGDFDLAQRHRALGPMLLAGTAFGIYSTVPDTEAARVLVGVALPFMALAMAWPVPLLGSGGAAATVTIWLLLAARDGATRPGAVIGAIGCLGLFVWEPIGRRVAAQLLANRPPAIVERAAVIVAALIFDALVVFWAARVAGLHRDGATAALLLAPAAIVGAVAAVLFLAPPPSRADVRRESPTIGGAPPRPRH